MSALYLIGYEGEQPRHATPNLVLSEWYAWRLGMVEIVRVLWRWRVPRRVQVISVCR